jgi:hypothetical protein
LLRAPARVEAEIDRQEVERPMSAEYRKILRDRLTLEYFFANGEVAFRRTPDGIEILAAGLDEIAQLRKTNKRAKRQGIVYGVG